MGQQFGVIGLAVMGENIALNIEGNGFPIAVYNRKNPKPSWRAGARDETLSRPTPCRISSKPWTGPGGF